jgi:hypothetical protein
MNLSLSFSPFVKIDMPPTVPATPKDGYLFSGQ